MIKRLRLIPFYLVIITFLSACANTPGLSVFSLTNAELESVLNKELPKLSERLNVMGLPVQFDVNTLKVNIGPDKREVVALDFDASAEIRAFGLRYPVRLALAIEGSPYYDSQQKAVFLRDLSLLDSSLDAGRFTGNLGLLDKEAMRLINAFLAVNPVYKLDMNNSRVKLLSALPLDLKVVEGAIQVVPRM